ncbi:MAG: lipoprotein [Wenzhouxiangellaceae bacterium]|nr:lipoprotein [Wenzhouxiangellaceae bacterium]
MNVILPARRPVRFAAACGAMPAAAMAAFLLVAVSTAGCGLKGDLYLPDEQQTSAPPIEDDGNGNDDAGDSEQRDDDDDPPER